MSDRGREFDSKPTRYILIDKDTGENLGHGDVAASDIHLQPVPLNASLVIPPDGVASDTHRLNMQTGQWDEFDARSMPEHVRVQGQMAINRRMLLAKSKPFESRAKGKVARYSTAEPMRLMWVAMVGGLLRMADGSLQKHTAAQGMRVLEDFVAAHDATELSAATDHEAFMAQMESNNGRQT